MAKSWTIVVWGREDLLSFSVELFLTRQKEWHVVSLSDEGNIEALILAIDKLNPNVVCIHQDNRTENSNLPMQLLQNHPGMKVITFSLQDNLIEVYSKHNIMVKSASDLISVVEMDTVKSAE